jgi:hypothetical protein
MEKHDYFDHITEDLVNLFTDPDNAQAFQARLEQLPEDDKWRIKRAARQLVALLDHRRELNQ